MKKRGILALALTLIMILAMAGCGNDAAPADSGGAAPAPAGSGSAAPADSGSEAGTEAPVGEVVELKLAYYTAADSSTGPVYEEFAKAIAEESGGTLTVTTFPAETLLANAEALDGVGNGQADFAHFMVAVASPVVKGATPLEVPGAYPGDKFPEYNAATLPILQELFAPHNIKYLSAIDQGTITFMSSKTLIKTPADMAGMMVRAPGKYVAEAITRWGASPVTVPLGDITTALERKTIDTSYGGWVISGPFGLYEMAPKVTYTTLQEGFAGLIMNMDTWNNLSPEHQAAVERAAVRYGEFSHTFAQENFDKVYKQIEESGAEIYTLTPEENAAFTANTDELLAMALEVAGEDGQKLVDALAPLRG